jgi:hypothetical protein
MRRADRFSLGLAVWVFLASLRPATADAQAFVPIGPEFRVDNSTTGIQTRPAIAMSALGTFVVAWANSAELGYDIHARRFDSSGQPLTNEFRVNTATGRSERYPSVAMAPGGAFVVVWTSAGEDGSDTGIFGRRYDASGSPQGAVFRANTYTQGDQSQPHVAMDPTGAFVVAWRSYYQLSPTSGPDIFAQRYDSEGFPLGGEFRVNTTTQGVQKAPAVAAGADGFVITFHGGVGGDPSDVAGQRYSVAGAPLGGEFVINTYTTGAQAESSVAMAPDGGFLVAWQSNGEDGSSYALVARRYSSGGAPFGDAFRVNARTTSDQRTPSVASDDEGRFVVVWETGHVAGAQYEVASRTVKKSGALAPGDVLVNSYTTSNQQAPVIAGGPGGRFVAVWSSYQQTTPTSSFDVYGRFLEQSGDANRDGAVTVLDVFYLINFLFAAGPQPLGPADPNHDGATNVVDVFHLINFLFAQGPDPA